MTLAKAIENFDAEHPNNAPFHLKVQWISNLDHKIYGEILIPRGKGEFEGYDQTTPQDTVLASPDCYGEIYTYYLAMKLDYINGEVARSNNNALLFNRIYKELFDYINRQTPVSKNTAITAGDLNV